MGYVVVASMYEEEMKDRDMLASIAVILVVVLVIIIALTLLMKI